MRNLARCTILLACLLVVGCGDDGSGDGGDAKAAPLTKTAFVKEAKAICEAASDEIQQQLSADPESFIASTAAGLRRDAEEIGDLGPPKGDEAQVEAILEGLREAVEMIESNAKNLDPATKKLAATEKLANKYGLEGCLLS